MFKIPEQTFVKIGLRSSFVQGARIEGVFTIDEVGTFDFAIASYDVPHADKSGGAFACLSQGSSTLFGFFVGKSPEGQIERSMLPLAQAFLVALRGAEGKITGLSSIDPVPFPLPEEYRCVPDMTSN